MNMLMVANDNGKMPKSYLKKLRSIAKYDWKYEGVAKCFFTEIDNTEEAKFIAMKIVAVLSQELPGCFCSYVVDKKTLFYQDRLRGYIPI